MPTHDDLVNEMTQQPTAQQVSQPDSPMAVIQTAMQEANAVYARAADQAEQRVAQTNTATGAMTQAVQDAASASATIALAEDTAALKAQKNRADVFAAAGGHTAQVALMEELISEVNRADDLSDKVAEIRSETPTGFAPLDKIIGSVKTIGLRHRRDVAQRQAASTLDSIQQVTAAQESFAKQSDLAKQSINAGTIAANQKKIKALATIDEQKAVLDSLQSNAQAVSALAAMKSQQVNQLVTGYRLKDEEANRSLERDRLELNKAKLEQDWKMLELELPAREAALEKAQLDLEAARKTQPSKVAALEAQYNLAVKRRDDMLALEQQQVEAVQKAQATGGVPVEDKETIVWGIKSGQQKYLKWREVGSTSGEAPVVYGGSPSEVVETLAMLDPTGNFKQTKASRYIQKIQRIQAERYQKAGTQPKNQDQLKADLDSTARDMLTQEMSNIEAGSLYAAPNMEVMGRLLENKGNKLYDEVLAPLNIQETDPKRIFDAAVAAIKAKAITAAEATEGLVSFFEVAVAYNNSQDGGYERYGLPAQTSYNAEVSRGSISRELFEQSDLDIDTGTLGLLVGSTGIALGTIKQNLLGRTTKVIDLTDPVQVMELIVNNLAANELPQSNSNKERP